MRILVWCPHHVSPGGVRVLASLISAISEQDDIQMITVVISPDTEFKERVGWEAYTNVQVVYLKGDNKNIMSFLDSCDIVYYNWPHAQNSVPINRPSVCTFQDIISFDLYDLYPLNVRQDIERVKLVSQQWLQDTTIVVSPSEYVKSRLVTHFGDVCNSSVVIPYAVSPTEIFSSRAPAHNSSLKLPSHYFVYPTNTSPHKNIFNLLTAYASFSQRKKYPLVLFGHGTEEIKYLYGNAYLKSTLKPDEDFYALGFISDHDVTPIINNSSALIMASLGEGTGLPVYEALSFGTPVLCSDLPVIRELLANRTAPINWFDPWTPASITQALEKMATDYHIYKQATIKGMKDPVKSWDEVAKQYVQVFRMAFLKYWGQQ